MLLDEKTLIFDKVDIAGDTFESNLNKDIKINCIMDLMTKIRPDFVKLTWILVQSDLSLNHCII